MAKKNRRSRRTGGIIQGNFADRAALSIEQVCLSLGVGRGLLSKLRRLGEGPPEVRIGGRIVVRPEALNEWLRRKEQQQHSTANFSKKLRY